MSTLIEWTSESNENRRLLAQEYLIASIAQRVWEVMERKGISRAQLAEALGKSRPFISQVLSGSKNLTLRTVADLADALGCEVEVNLRSNSGGDWEELPHATQEKVVQFTHTDLSCNQDEWTTLGSTNVATEAA